MDISIQEYEESRRYFQNINRLDYREPPTTANYRRLTKNYPFTLNNVHFTILRGFWWDGASIPRAAWTLVGHPWSRDIAPGALIHDLLYVCKLFTREHTDDILYEVNKYNNMGWAKNKLVYGSVRAFGGSHWNQQTETQIAGGRKHLLINGLPAQEVLRYDHAYKLDELLFV